MAWILFWYGDLYGNRKTGIQRNRTHHYGSCTAGNLLCDGWNLVVPVYAGISNGQMGYGEKYPVWSVTDNGNYNGVLCESGDCEPVFEDAIKKKAMHGRKMG